MSIGQGQTKTRVIHSPPALRRPPRRDRFQVRPIVCLVAALICGVAPSLLAQPVATGAPTLVCPSSGGSDEILAVHLGSGAVAQLEPQRRDPLRLGWKTQGESLFQTIGRPDGQAARVGEILLTPIYNGDRVEAAIYVEPRIGYLAYFDKFGKGGKLGEFGSVLGRPFEGIAAMDDNFVLLPRRDGSGRTVGVYLYHGTTGRAVYADGIDKLSTEPKTLEVGPLPTMTGRVAAAPIHVGGRATAAYLLLDSGNGQVHLVELGGGASQLTARTLDLNLFDAFGREASRATQQRLVAAPIDDGGHVTRAVLVLDAAGGGMALIDGLVGGTPRLLGLEARLDGALGNDGDGERVLSLAPHTALDGGVEGVWIFDSLSGRAAYVRNPASPTEILVETVILERD